MPYRPRHSMPKLDAAVMSEWAAAIAGIWARMGGEPVVLDASGPRCDPLRAFEDHEISAAHGEAMQSGDALLLGWLGKLAGTKTRIAAVLTLLEDPNADAVSESAPWARAATRGR